jgi:hypothetical protein
MKTLDLLKRIDSTLVNLCAEGRPFESLRGHVLEAIKEESKGISARVMVEESNTMLWTDTHYKFLVDEQGISGEANSSGPLTEVKVNGKRYKFTVQPVLEAIVAAQIEK